ncbi:hypothetical protein EDB83DRAFT_2525167 [Lactarius deliciosus]|nr:hypothetical protein EDB83DRAFT_2525167 [Lactarius deliciosus]
MPLSTRHGKKERRTIDLANLPQPVPMLGFGPALVQRPSKASKRKREHDSEPHRRRPFLFETLRASLLTRIVADTLDWDALMHHDFDATVLSLDTVYKALNHDRETYYLLWVAVRKVLAEESSPDLTRACGNNVSGCNKYEKTRLLKELLDAVLEQFLAELGNALLEFVDGTHCTILDPREHSDDPCVFLAKARSLIARFERLGRDRDTIMVAIPATEAGIAAAASLQCEDGINVNLTSVSGVMHAAACAQAGAAAVTMSIAAIRDWHRDRGRVNRRVTCLEENTGAGSDDAIGDAQTIAAYFQQHGIVSTRLLACKIGHVDDACSLAALGALSFDADQARAAEWYDGYPHVPRTIPDSATRRAASFSSPLPLARDERGRARGAQRTLKRMDAEALSAYSAVVYAALGSGRAAMSMIADIAKREIDWQLALLRPMYTVVLHPVPQQSAVDNASQPWPQDLKRKRTCRASEALRVPDAHSPRKRSKLASGEYCCTVPDRSEATNAAGSRNEEVEADEGDGDGEWGDEEGEDAPTRGGRLWQRLAPASERNEEVSSAPVEHAREEVPEFGPAVRSCDGGEERRQRGEHRTATRT